LLVFLTYVYHNARFRECTVYTLCDSLETAVCELVSASRSSTVFCLWKSGELFTWTIQLII